MRAVVPLVLLATITATCGRSDGSRVDAATLGRAVTWTRAGEITLSGVVTATFGAHVFAVGSGGERVIVVTRSPIAVSAGRDVEVTGRARTFERRELESELAVDLGPQVDDLENARCLVADVARVR